MTKESYKKKYFKYKQKYINLMEVNFDFINQNDHRIDCEKLAKFFLSKNEMLDKKRTVYDFLLQNVFDVKNFIKLTPKHIKKTFIIIDKVYFNGTINKYIDLNNIDLIFKTSAKLTKTAGICKHIYISDENKYKYQIGISSIIIGSIFNKGEKSMKINGIECFNRLECYINLFEHELTHLIIFLFCPELGEKRGGHTLTFLKIVRNLFGHSEYKHMLLCGDYQTMEVKKEDIKANIEVGDYIISKKINGKVYEGIVKKINPKSVRILLESGKTLNLYYHVIDKIQEKVDKKNFKKAIKKKDDLKKLKKSLRKGNLISVKIKGKIKKGTIISVNPKRVKVKIDDETWYVPYRLILLENL